jgi:hypothetical protein
MGFGETERGLTWLVVYDNLLCFPDKNPYSSLILHSYSTHATTFRPQLIQTTPCSLITR